MKQFKFDLCLNPFGTGQGLSTKKTLLHCQKTLRLNPFGTGRGLSTIKYHPDRNPTGVSIPLEQGRVFRPIHVTIDGVTKCLNPFGTGRGLSTEAIKQKPELSKMLDNVALHKDMQAKGISAESLKSSVIQPKQVDNELKVTKLKNMTVDLSGKPVKKAKSTKSSNLEL